MSKSNPRWTTDASQAGLKPAFPLDFRASGGVYKPRQASDAKRLHMTGRRQANGMNGRLVGGPRKLRS